jgi:hypothetical protein
MRLQCPVPAIRAYGRIESDAAAKNRQARSACAAEKRLQVSAVLVITQSDETVPT